MSMSNAFLRLGVVFALIGVGLGYWMGASQQFTASPVHAHINLLGWVSMFLYGLFYRAFPAAAAGWLAKAHLGLSVIGLLIFMPALAIKLLHVESVLGLAEPGLMAGPTLVLLGMIAFAAIVFGATGKRAAAV